MNKLTLPKPNHELGYTKLEILEIIGRFNIREATFWDKFGVNTCAMDIVTGESIMYPHDVELTIRCCLEKRDKTVEEWD